MNLIDRYFPSPDEIKVQDLSDAMTRLTEWYRTVDPTMDTRPGSVFGDNVLLPQAILLKAMETAVDRLLGDINLGNIAAGQIHDCDVATAFVQNFGRCPKDGLLAMGVIRLVFNQDTEVTIDRGTRFRFNNDTASVFRPRLYHQGELVIRDTGQSPDPSKNELQLTPISSNLWAVDIQVSGSMGAVAVQAGDDADSDRLFPNLVSANALYDFNDGVPAASLPLLAERICKTIYSVSPAHRGGANSYVLTEFPDAVTASTVLPGDDEMTRATNNAMGVWSNVADVYVASSKNVRLEEQVIKLRYIDEIEGSSVNLLVGEWRPVGIPLLISGFRLASSDSENILIDGDAVKILSQSRNSYRAPWLSSAYSTLERLYLVMQMPQNDGGANLIPTTLDEDGNAQAFFTLSYYSEGLVPLVHSAMTSEEITSPLVDVIVRSQLPVVIKNLEITYDRRKGKTMLLDQARAEIKDHFQNSGYPSRPSEVMIADSMLYAGASRVLDVEIEAELRWTVATHAIADNVDPTVDPEGALATGVEVEPLEIMNFDDLIPREDDPNRDEPGDLKRSSGPRNLRWIITSDAITFIENS